MVPSTDPAFDFEFSDPFQFTGGTGRFANATGEATITGNANLTAGRSSMTTSGSLRY